MNQMNQHLPDTNVCKYNMLAYFR